MQNFQQDESRKKWRRWMLLALFLAVAVTGYFYARSQPQILAEETVTEGETLAFGAAIQAKYRYELCGHEMEQEVDIRRYIGLTKQELAEEFPGFTVEEFSPMQAVLQRHYSCYCPDHTLVYLEGEEAVLKKCEDFEENFEELERIPIRAEQLSQEDRQALWAGKVFPDAASAREFLRPYRKATSLWD